MGNIPTDTLRHNFWEKDRLNGGRISYHYKELQEFDNLDYTEATIVQQRKLHDILEYAVTNCQFYSQYDPHNLTSFPVIDKMVLIDNRDIIEIPANKIPMQRGKVHIQTTSGSTGTPLAVSQDTEKRNRRIAELKYFGQKVGYISHESLIQFRTWNRWQQKSLTQIREENIFPFDISVLDDAHLKNLVSLISQEQPVALRGYASSLHLVAEYFKKHGLPKIPSLVVSFSGSEMLMDESRDLIKQNLGGDVISQYANEECGILAQERTPTSPSDNPMYLNNASYVIELLKLESNAPAEWGELGRIVITDLYNKAFPIIRYDTGDTAIFAKEDAFSKGFPIIRKLFGRRVDLIYSSTGSPIHPIVFGRTLKNYGNIAQWQFIQNDEDKYELRLIMRDSSEDNNISKILDELHYLLKVPTSNIDIKFVSEIPVLKSAKRKPVLNNWHK